LKARRYWLAGASRSTEPRSHSCITAIAVKVLVIEAIRKTVFWVIGVSESMSASPCPEKNPREPSRITPTARPTVGQWLRILRTSACNSSSSIAGCP